MRLPSYPSSRASNDSPPMLGISDRRLPTRNPLRGDQPPLPSDFAALKEKLHLPRTQSGTLPFDDTRVDACLPGGGLPLGHLHEIGTTGLQSETGAMPAAFVAALIARVAPTRPVFWISTIADLYPNGLLDYGLDPARLMFVRTNRGDETLSAMEVALRGGGAATVVGEIGALDRTTSRRLQLACLRSGVTGFVLRRWLYGQRKPNRESTASVTRWRLAPVPSEHESREPGLPRWHVALTHARGGRPGNWIMEASNDAAHTLRVVAALADNAPHAQSLRHAG